MAGRDRRRTATRVFLVAALAVLVDPVAAVQAQNVPADQEIERARDAQARADRAVADAEDRLAALGETLDDARIRTAIAVETYNGARHELKRAQRAEEAAVTEAGEVRGERTAAQVELGRRAAAAYRSGGNWSELNVVVNIVTDESIVDITEALATVARSQSVVHTRWTRALGQAESAVGAAERRVAERVAAERDAAQALERAERAVEAHEEAVARAGATRDALIAELAAARGTTAELERERRQAREELERQERERSERERAERDGATGGTAEHTRQEPAAEEPAAEDDGGQPESDAGDEPDPPGEQQATETVAEPAGQSFDGSTAAGRAVDYARAQLGKPYLWAGAGPESFDCSGLTMRAWEQGGVHLTHWSVAQARQAVPVSYSDLRPGDLIFWSSNDAPSGTYHVALYVGGGEMIHAPSPGGRVEVRDVFYWRTPSFYARVTV